MNFYLNHNISNVYTFLSIVDSTLSLVLKAEAHFFVLEMLGMGIVGKPDDNTCT